MTDADDKETKLRDKETKLRDKWIKRLAQEDKAHSIWRKRAKTADDCYLSYEDQQASPLYPVFSVTINVIHGKIYGQPPKPDVRKRYKSSSQSPGGQPQSAMAGAQVPPAQAPQSDPTQAANGSGGFAQAAGAAGGLQGVPSTNGQIPTGVTGNQSGGGGFDPSNGQNQAQGQGAPTQSVTEDDNAIATCLERAISYTIDTTQFDRDAHLVVNDFLITGLGIAKVELQTETKEIPVISPATMQPMLDEDGKPVKTQQITEQKVHLRHFHWSQFRWDPCKDWRSCNWVCFDHYMTKDDIEDEFEVDLPESSGSTTNFAGSNKGDSVTGIRPPQMDKADGTFTVHEIWDKRTETRLYITEGYDKVLRKEDDPLELEDFFPCPCPMLANCSGRELLPSPDFWTYQSLVKQADELADRVMQLTKQVKDISFYDQAFGELKKKNEYPDGTMISVQNLLAKLRSVDGKAEADAVILQLPMEEKVAVLTQLNQQLEIVKQRIYEFNGIADIQRGVSNPDETATAQRIKDQWADIRTGQRVQVVALFFRDIFRLMSNVISNKFVAHQIEAMTGMMLSDTQLGTLRSDLASCYAVDVESDSTMVANDAMDQEQLGTFLQALVPLLEQLVPAVNQGAFPADIAKEIFVMVCDTFKSGRQLNQAVEELPSTLQQLQQMNQTIQSTQQQLQQTQQQNQQLTTQVQQFNQQEQARKDSTAQADNTQKYASAQKTTVDAQKTASDIDSQKLQDMAATVDLSRASRADIIEGNATGLQ